MHHHKLTPGPVCESNLTQLFPRWIHYMNSGIVKGTNQCQTVKIKSLALEFIKFHLSK